jgi:hypothetical protein
MKKKLISVLSIIIMLGMVNMASAISNYSEIVTGGEWIEMYGDGGPGQLGAYLNAVSFPSDTLVTWSLNDMILTTSPGTPIGLPDGHLVFTTQYSGGNIVMSDTTEIGNLSATVIADIQNGIYYGGTITMTGIVTNNGSGIFFMSATLTEYEDPSWASVVNGDFDLAYGHNGEIIISDLRFDPINTTVPEPTSLLLLGLGMIGLAGFRRKFKK